MSNRPTFIGNAKSCCHWTRTFSGQLMDQTLVVIFAVNHLVRERLGYIRNPLSLMEGMEMLCRDDIRGFTWEPQSCLTLRENANEYWLVDFAYLSHSLFIRVYIGDRCIHSSGFPLRSRERVPGTQRWTIKIVAWGHNVSVPSIREQGFPISQSRST